MRAKIVRVTLKNSDRNFLAVCVEEDKYLMVDGRMCTSAMCTNVKGTRNVPDAVRSCLQKAADAYAKKKQMQKKQEEIVQKLAKECNELQMQISSCLDDARKKMGILSDEEFGKEFEKNLPDWLKEEMKHRKFSVEEPTGIAYANDCIYVSRMHVIQKYCRNRSFIYEEYDGCCFIIDNPEKDKEYMRILRENSRKLNVSPKYKLQECLNLGDKDTLYYTACYEIQLKQERTKEYAKELAESFAGERK